MPATIREYTDADLDGCRDLAEAIRFFHREGFDVLDRVELTKPIGRRPDPSAGTADVHGRTFRF